MLDSVWRTIVSSQLFRKTVEIQKTVPCVSSHVFSSYHCNKGKQSGKQYHPAIRTHYSVPPNVISCPGVIICIEAHYSLLIPAPHPPGGRKTDRVISRGKEGGTAQDTHRLKTVLWREIGVCVTRRGRQSVCGKLCVCVWGGAFPLTQ